MVTYHPLYLSANPGDSIFTHLQNLNFVATVSITKARKMIYSITL